MNLEQLEYKWLKQEFALDTISISELIDETFLGISPAGIKSKHQSLLSMYRNIADRHKEGVFGISLNLKKCKSISMIPLLPWSLS